MILAVTGFHRTVVNLRGLTSSRSNLSDDNFYETAFVNKLKAEDRPFILYVYQVSRLPLLYLLGNYAQALDTSVELERNRDHFLGMFYLVHLNFYYSLTLTALYSESGQRKERLYWKLLKRNQKTMKTWADSCPENFLHRYLLVKAEMARLMQNYQEAEDCYDQSIQLARNNEFVQEEGIANELAASFHLSRGRDYIALAYLTEAIFCYRKWGAAAKIKQLEEKHKYLLERSTGTAFEAVTMQKNREKLPLAGSSALDLTTVLKASQAISGVISLKKLLRELMKIVMENAGAQRGLLILEHEGQLCIEAEGTAGDEIFSILGSVPVKGSKALAESVVFYTARTQEAVVLNDAVHEGMFINDLYIKGSASKSILCTPILNKRRLTGVLYLENNLTSHAFTPARVQILDALSSQIAISLENAKLYEEARFARKSLQESEHKFRTLAETTKAGIVIYRDNRFLYVNPAAESITGYGRDEFLTMNFSSIIHPDYLHLLTENAAARMPEKPAPEQYEFKIVRKDGDERWMMATGGRIEYGNEKAMIATLFDITSHKQAEQERLRLYEENIHHYRERIDEQQRHQREKENILMDIHDGIGGITTNIVMLSEIAQKASSPGDIKKSLATITNLAREGTTEIRSLMFSLDSRDHSWRALMAEINNHGTKTFKPHAIEFEMVSEIEETEAEPGSLLFLHLFRIYKEALTNIVKHARATKVTVLLHVDRERLVLTVLDNGQGCDETTIAGKGRGVKNMRVRAAKLGGSVTITGRLGTCVSLEVPLSKKLSGSQL